jgi:hypothetical protein
MYLPSLSLPPLAVFLEISILLFFISGSTSVFPVLHFIASSHTITFLLFVSYAELQMTMMSDYVISRAVEPATECYRPEFVYSFGFTVNTTNDG